jgi:hypothetical protein
VRKRYLLAIYKRHDITGRKTADGDGHIVAGRRQSTDFAKYAFGAHRH